MCLYCDSSQGLICTGLPVGLPVRSIFIRARCRVPGVSACPPADYCPVARLYAHSWVSFENVLMASASSCSAYTWNGVAGVAGALDELGAQLDVAASPASSVAAPPEMQRCDGVSSVWAAARGGPASDVAMEQASGSGFSSSAATGGLSSSISTLSLAGSRNLDREGTPSSTMLHSGPYARFAELQTRVGICRNTFVSS